VIIETHLDQLRKMSVLIATPMYGGMCTGDFANSLSSLLELAGKYGLSIQFRHMVNESLIQRARNRLTYQFLSETECTHLMFIDADISFSPLDVISLMVQASGSSDKSVVCGVYPKKGIDWDQIRSAAEAGVAGESPEKLANLGASFAFDVALGAAKDFKINQPQEAKYAGTGFMMIQRRVFDLLKSTLKDQTYFDPIAGKDGDTVTAYFECEIDPDTRVYLSEDYTFCKRVHNAGEKIWICPWIKLAHVGTYIYQGSLSDFASAGLPVHK
jgi:hypothetical protein